MGRINKYDECVKPYLSNIQNWIGDMSEIDICKKLGVSHQAFNTYKNKYPELKQALNDGRKQLVIDLKDSLKKKAKGFYYTETKTTIRKNGDEDIVTVEEYKKYAQPDTGAIHLLLKNLCEDWHNDDNITIKLKQAQIDIAKTKAEVSAWS